MGYGLGTGQAVRPLSDDVAIGRELQKDHDDRLAEHVMTLAANEGRVNSGGDDEWLMLALLAAIILAAVFFLKQK